MDVAFDPPLEPLESLPRLYEEIDAETAWAYSDGVPGAGGGLTPRTTSYGASYSAYGERR